MSNEKHTPNPLNIQPARPSSFGPGLVAGSAGRLAALVAGSAGRLAAWPPWSPAAPAAWPPWSPAALAVGRLAAWVVSS